MGFLSNLFSGQDNQFSKDAAKLKGLFVSKNGLFRNKNGSLPTVEQFTELGYSEDDYFRLTHGVDQEQLQNRLMQRTREKRNKRISTMSNRLAVNSKKKYKPRNTTQQLSSMQPSADYSLMMFSPLSFMGSPTGEEKIMELSLLTTGDPFAFFNGDYSMFDNDTQDSFTNFGSDQFDQFNSFNHNT